MKIYNKKLNGIGIDMMGNYHGGCKKSCCKNSWGGPTIKGKLNNCKYPQYNINTNVIG